MVVNPLPLAEIEQGKKAVVRDSAQGNRLYCKHCFGQPLPGGGLELSLLEAAYLLEQGRLAVCLEGRQMDFMSLLWHLETQTGIGFHRYAGYRDLKTRGLIIKPTSPFDFSLYPGGTPLRRSLSRRYVDMMSERENFKPLDIYSRASRAEELRKGYTIGVVDEEGDVTYYSISISAPKGSVEHVTPAGTMEGTLIGGRVLVIRNGILTDLYGREFFGQMHGSSHQLSLVEAAFLISKGVLIVKAVDEGIEKTDEVATANHRFSRFLDIGNRYERDLTGRYALYEDLKRRGLIVKTGFKYGAYFRAYCEDPETSHAKYLVHLIPCPEGFGWPEVSRSVRVAHGVRKKMIFAFRSGDAPLSFLKVERVKPSS